MTHFRFLPGALTDLEEATAWYEKQQPGLAAELLDEFETCIQAAIESPKAGSLSETTMGGNEIRRYRLRRFRRYAILMAVIDEVPIVVAVEHSSRRPGYWKDRVR